MGFEINKKSEKRWAVHNKDAETRAVYGGYELLSSDSTSQMAEEAYRKAWSLGMSVCEFFKFSPTRIKMIVKLIRCENETNYVDVIGHDKTGTLTLAGWELMHHDELPDSCAMSVGRRLQLWDYEESLFEDMLKYDRDNLPPLVVEVGTKYKICSAIDKEE